MKLYKILSLIHLLTGFIVCGLLSSLAHSASSKWVDENGQIHYSDRIPSRYLGGKYSKLNDQGVTLSTSNAIKTKKELSEEQKLRRIKAEENKKRLIISRKKALRDRVLLYTFTTENDLILARDARLDAIDSQISLANTLIRNDKIKLSTAKGRITAVEKRNQKAPENFYKKVAFVKQQINNNQIYIKEKSVERQKILDAFDEDISRFRQLKKEQHDARERRRKAEEEAF